MNKEDVIRLANNESDERTLLVQIKAQKLAGKAAAFYVAVLSLMLAIDGFLLEHIREFDHLTVMIMLMSVGTVNFAVNAAYEWFHLHKKSSLVDFIIFGVLTLIWIVFVILFFIG